MRVLLVSAGLILMIVNAALAAAVLAQFVNGAPGSSLEGSIGAFIIFGGFAVGGYVLTRYALRRPSTTAPPHSSFEREQAILALAESSHGRLTVPEVAAHCHIGLEFSKRALDQLVIQQAADLRVADNGTLVYIFPGFISDAEKRAAEEI